MQLKKRVVATVDVGEYRCSTAGKKQQIRQSAQFECELRQSLAELRKKLGPVSAEIFLMADITMTDRLQRDETPPFLLHVRDSQGLIYYWSWWRSGPPVPIGSYFTITLPLFKTGVTNTDMLFTLEYITCAQLYRPCLP